MIELIKTDVFDRWLRSLRDTRARAKITVRLRRLSLGNPSDVKPVGEGISELRIPHGPGYRVYYLTRGPIVVVLLCGPTRAASPATSSKPKPLPSNGRSNPWQPNNR